MKVQNLPAQLTSDGTVGTVIGILTHEDATGNQTAVCLFVEPKYGQTSEQPANNIKFTDPTMKNLILG